jgi:glycosyltransferase involved in cell wall biosynthesis
MKIILFANTEWYLHNFRLPLARRLREAGAEVVFLSPPGPYGEGLRAAGFRWLPFSMERRSLNPLRELGVLMRLTRLLQREKPDAVHNFTVKCVVYGSLAAWLAGVGHRINALAGMGYVFGGRDLRARILRPFVRVLVKLALAGSRSRLILQNLDDSGAVAGASFLPGDHIRLIRGSGVNTSLFSPRTESKKARRANVLLAARLLWNKGVGDYVAAARRLKNAGINANFLLAGKPDPGNPLSVPAEKVAAWREEGCVIPLGHVENMPEVFGRADVVVLPSTYGEGVPRILIEAAACGLAIVTADSPGCREIVRHGVNGLLVPPHDIDALAAAIRSLLDDPAARARMGAAGRALVLAEFDERLVLDRTLSVYREILELSAGEDGLRQKQAENAVIVV